MNKDRSLPDQGGAALLIIDMINRFDFPGSEELLPKALAAADIMLSLRAAADRCDVPTIYVNDNYGEWHSDRDRLIERCLKQGSGSRELVEKIRPREQDLFIIKPQVSGFYATNLQVLLPQLGASRLVLTGIATDICVLFTAADAHMRDYVLWVPADAVASDNDDHGRWALQTMEKSMAADTQPTGEQTLDAWLSRCRAVSGAEQAERS
jgi:nicotinamidase-related amidase